MFHKEFKEALSRLPSKEKDKLILRLLKKDLVLANRLLFELLSTNTVEEERQKMTDEEHFTKLMECEIFWEEELEKHGIERLGVDENKNDQRN